MLLCCCHNFWDCFKVHSQSWGLGIQIGPSICLIIGMKILEKVNNFYGILSTYSSFG